MSRFTEDSLPRIDDDFLLWVYDEVAILAISIFVEKCQLLRPRRQRQLGDALGVGAVGMRGDAGRLDLDGAEVELLVERAPLLDDDRGLVAQKRLLRAQLQRVLSLGQRQRRPGRRRLH